MKPIELNLQGKRENQQLCEDGYFCGQRFAVVVDGATSKGAYSFAGMTSGCLAKKVILEFFANADKKSTTLGSKLECVEQLLEGLDSALKQSALDFTDKLEVIDYPRASIIYWDRDLGIVVSYGDCQCLIDNEFHDHQKKVDAINSELRSKKIKELLAEGRTVEELLVNDLGREAIKPLLVEQFQYENKDCELGYPVLNGMGINKSMIQIYNVQGAKQLVLASDGYPVLCGTLQESEKHLAQILADDPLLYKICKSTKGLQPGLASFDDRCYLRFKL